MQELKITDGKLYHHHEGVWNPISVESTPHYYGYHERDLTQGGKNFHNVQVFDRYASWHIPMDLYLGINRHFAGNIRSATPSYYCFDGSLRDIKTLGKDQLMQLYFTGQKELPNEVVEYREPVGDTSILRKFDGGINTIKYHDMYFHLLRTPMESADNTGKRRTLVIQIQWVNVPEDMYFLYFPTYRTSDYNSSTHTEDMYYAITHTDQPVTKAEHNVIHATISMTKDDRCKIVDDNGKILYDEDANPQIQRLRKEDAGGKKYTQIIFDFPADSGDNRNTMGAIAFDPYIHEDKVSYHRIPLHPFLLNYEDFPPAMKNSRYNMTYFQWFPVFMKQGDMLEVLKWNKNPEEGSPYLTKREIMCIGPAFTSPGVLAGNDSQQQPWLFQTPGPLFSKVDFDEFISKPDRGGGFYTWVK